MCKSRFVIFGETQLACNTNSMPVLAKQWQLKMSEVTLRLHLLSFRKLHSKDSHSIEAGGEQSCREEGGRMERKATGWNGMRRQRKGWGMLRV